MLHGLCFPHHKQYMPEFQDRHVVLHNILSMNPILNTLPVARSIEKKLQPYMGSGSIRVRSYAVGDRFADAKFLRSLVKKINARTPVDGVFSINSDNSFVAGMTARDYLDLTKNTHMKVGDYRALVDKRLMKARVASVPGFNTSAFLLLEKNMGSAALDFANQRGYPIMLKKGFSTGSAGVYKLDSREELESELKKIQGNEDKYLVEAFVPGDIVRINGYFLDGEVKVIITANNRFSVLDFYRGQSVGLLHQFDNDAIGKERVEQFVENMRVAFEIDSAFFHAEAIWNREEDRLYFLEVAPRPGEGKVDAPYQQLYNFDQKAVFQSMQSGNPKESPELFQHREPAENEGFAILRFPFQRVTFQKVKIPFSVEELRQELPTLAGEHIHPALLKNGVKGKHRLALMPHETYSPFMALWFVGDKQQVQKDVDVFLEKYQPKAKPIGGVANQMVPTSLLQPGGF